MNVNWERRQKCNQCGAPKPGTGDQRREGQVRVAAAFLGPAMRGGVHRISVSREARSQNYPCMINQTARCVRHVSLTCGLLLCLLSLLLPVSLHSRVPPPPKGGGFKELDEAELEEARRRRQQYKQGGEDDEE